MLCPFCILLCTKYIQMYIPPSTHIRFLPHLGCGLCEVLSKTQRKTPTVVHPGLVSAAQSCLVYTSHRRPVWNYELNSQGLGYSDILLKSFNPQDDDVNHFFTCQRCWALSPFLGLRAQKSQCPRASGRTLQRFQDHSDPELLHAQGLDRLWDWTTGGSGSDERARALVVIR